MNAYILPFQLHRDLLVPMLSLHNPPVPQQKQRWHHRQRQGRKVPMRPLPARSAGLTTMAKALKHRSAKYDRATTGAPAALTSRGANVPSTSA